MSAVLLLPGCVRPPQAGSRTILDQQTGNTLLLVQHPLVFARERTDVAAHARDYATLVAVEVDAAGHYSNYLLVYRWSTVDKRMAPPPQVGSGKLQVEADGRTIVLAALEQLPVGVVGQDGLLYPPHADVVTYAYPIDWATLRFLAQSNQILLRMPQDALDTPFGLWEDGRASLAQFVRSEGTAQ
ncbi:MAG: hypothetical protein WA825_13325 [Steroidobacteraceae bacterium]